MRRISILACLVAIATIAAAVITTARRPASPPAMGGEAAPETPIGWDIFLLDFGVYHGGGERSSPSADQERRFLVADLRITNTQQGPSAYTFNDFELKAEDGRLFKAALQTASIEHG